MSGKKGFEDEKKYPLYFPVFKHTNSGYAFVYNGNKKDTSTIYVWHKKFISDLNNKFHGYPVVNIRSDKESGFNNKAGFLGKFTTLQKRKDDTHILMARINNFS